MGVILLIVTYLRDFLDKVEPGDGIMMDRGFNVGELLARGAKSICHLSPEKNSTGKKTLNQSEIKRTRDIASLRIHVERVIGRMKKIKILSKKIHVNEWPRLRQLLVIVAVICNLDPPLLKY